MQMKSAIFAVLLYLQVVLGTFLDGPMNVKKVWKDEEETPEFWLNLGKEELDNSLRLQKLNKNVAKNVILFLGDGMSIPTITTARILKGQKHGPSGVDAVLTMDQFEHVGLSKTYNVDKQVPDSAATSTAYLCGVKATFFTLGLSAAARLNNCSSVEGNEVDSILIDAYRAGKSTGIVTTTRINHATPAGTYAHSPHRMWYDDAAMPPDAIAEGCKDIAQQFYDNSHMITVALGGGRAHFQPNTTHDPEHLEKRNFRKDGQDLITKWKDDQKKRGLSASYVWNLTEFDKVDPAVTDRLLGLFEHKDMYYEVDRSSDKAGEPSLAEMTEKSLQILQKNPKGYFLLVEGGRIDHAHHNNLAHKALHDTLAFDDAIAKARNMTSDEDTLIIVTADHSHTFNFGGMTDRGVSIFGMAEMNGERFLGLDSKPYTSLLYGNGPSYRGMDLRKHNFSDVRTNLTDEDTGHKSFQQQSAVPLLYETHGGDDVAIMAQGPMSHLIHGVHQQSYIAYVMRYASCLGEDKRHCQEGSDDDQTMVSFLFIDLSSSTASVLLIFQFAFINLLSLFVLIFACVLVKQRKQKREQNSYTEKYAQVLLDRKLSKA